MGTNLFLITLQILHNVESHIILLCLSLMFYLSRHASGKHFVCGGDDSSTPRLMYTNKQVIKYSMIAKFVVSYLPQITLLARYISLT